MAEEGIEEEAERLYKSPKVLLGKIDWKALFEGLRQRIDLPVIVEGTGESLQLRGSVGTDGEFEFILTMRRTQLIRQWHSHNCHRNPGGEHVEGPHKHYPTRKSPTGKHAYAVDDIPTDDLNQALIAFLEECNITPFEPIQGRLIV